MRNLIKGIAFVSALTSVPAFAFSQSNDPANEPFQEADPAEQLLAPDENQEVTGVPVEGQIVLQSQDTILAKDMRGLTVYSASGEVVGDINDIIINFDGTVEGVVIGVGGFLGIGEKDVAIELSKFELADRTGGGMQLLLNATREDLKAAPAFKTALEQQLEREAEQVMQRVEEGLPPATDVTE